MQEIAAGLHALGVRRGDTVALMLRNRKEFNLVDAAAMHLGATPFSVYNTSSTEQIAYVFGHAGNRVVITEPDFLDRVTAARSPEIERVVCLDDAPAGTLSLDAVVAGGPEDFDFEAQWRAVQPDDVLTLIYTSGTTGPPKGVEITHANMMASVRSTGQLIPMQSDGRCVSYLPSAHIADRWITHYYSSITFGGLLTAVPDAQQIMAALPEIRPTLWMAVPRIWEKLKAGLETQGMTDPAAMPDEAKRAVRAKLGLDQIELVVSGAAPLGVDVLHYFAALGIEICEGWGMSELAAVGTINPPGRTKPGTVGLPVPGLELRLADDGELLCRGPIVMKGYRTDPERTAEALDGDGWLHTGDIAKIDEDGYVAIVDRKKEIIVNAAGKNMSPANIETVLKSASPLIGQAVTIGDRRPYNVALVVLDPDAAAAWAQANGVAGASPEELAGNDQLRAAVETAVAEANKRLSRVEQCKKFTILPVDWQPGGDELTPTMKLKRKPIAEKYGAEIDALYAG